MKQKINVFPHVYVASISTCSLYSFHGSVAAKLCAAADANESYINSAFNCFALLIYAKSGNKFSVPKSPWCRFQRRSLRCLFDWRAEQWRRRWRWRRRPVGRQIRGHCVTIHSDRARIQCSQAAVESWVDLRGIVSTRWCVINKQWQWRTTVRIDLIDTVIAS